jgi:hypothetical protein
LNQQPTTVGIVEPLSVNRLFAFTTLLVQVTLIRFPLVAHFSVKDLSRNWHVCCPDSQRQPQHCAPAHPKLSGSKFRGAEVKMRSVALLPLLFLFVSSAFGTQNPEKVHES